MIIAFILGCLYAWVGLRLLMVMDSIHDSLPHRWANGSELRAWVLMVLWPLAILVDLLVWAADRALHRIAGRRSTSWS